MTRRAGSADLPLHGGHVPKWLADRMTRLGAVMTQAIVHHYGRDELLRRLSHPFWFQSFGAVMGMDWHSSGITTSVIGALKRGLTPLGGELGVHICGGRGKHSRQTPAELFSIGERVGFDGGWQRPPIEGRKTSPNCCSPLVLELGRSARWRWSLKSYTELPIASAILPGSLSHTAAKMGTHSRSRCGSMTRRSES